MDEVGMAVSKNTQTRFVGITYHIHYASLRLLFEQPCTHIIYGAHAGMLDQYQNTIATLYILNQKCIRVC